MNNYVYGLAVSGGTLYAGGEFTTAGGVSATNIAQWNGSRWSPLGSGMNSFVSALAVSEGTLYAGGEFTTAGGVSANYIAQWNGSSWSALGSGVNDSGQNWYVSALAVSGGILYAGGGFATAGGKVSGYAAEAVLVSPEILSERVRSADGSTTLNLSTATNSSSRLYSATNLTSSVVWQPIYTNFNGGLWQFTDTNTAQFNTKFYRVSTP
jgi:hypothetical protein